MKISYRLFMGFSVVLAVMITMALFAIWSMTRISEQTSLLYEHPLAVSNATLRIRVNISIIQDLLAHTGQETDKDPTLKIAQRVKALDDAVLRDLDIINRQFLGERYKYENALAAYTAWKRFRDEHFGHTAQTQTKDVTSFAAISHGHVGKIAKTLDEINAFAMGKAVEFRRHSKEIKDSSFRSMYLFLGISFVFSAGLAFLISKSILRPLYTMKDTIDGISAMGKLDSRLAIQSKDEFQKLSRAFNEMIERLTEVTSSRDELNQEVASRIQTEGKLKESLQKISLLLSSTAEGIYSLDLNGICTLANPSSLRMLGYDSEEELIGKNIHNLIHHHCSDEEIPIDQCRILKGLVAGEGTHVDTEVFWRKDGSSFPVEYWSHPIIRDGEIVGGVVTFIDISERKEAQGKLLKSVTENQVLLDSTRAVLENKPFAHTSRNIFDSCKSLTGAMAGYIALLSSDGEENEVLFLDSGGRECTVDPNLRMPIRGLRAEAYINNTVALENDFMHSAWVEFIPGGHVTLNNVLFAPLAIEGKLVGVMGLANKPSDFVDEDIRIASAFGDLAAVALKNSRLHDSLVATIGEKQNLIREINHRIKNNFTVLQSLIALQSRNIKGSDTKCALMEVQGRVKSMTLIHERLYRTEGLRKMDLKEYTSTLVSLLADTYREPGKHISVHNNVPCVELDVQTMIPYGLILNELITNTMKYAFAGRTEGTISISVERAGEREYILTVTDNGVGLCADFEERKNHSLGMNIINALTAQLEGQLSIISDKGVTARVKFFEQSN